MSSILTEIITLLTGGITGVATGVGAGLSTLATSIFMQGEGNSQTLSVFGSLIVIFAGISLAEPIALASLNCYKKLECFNTNQNGSYYVKVCNTCNA